MDKLKSCSLICQKFVQFYTAQEGQPARTSPSTIVHYLQPGFDKQGPNTPVFFLSFLLKPTKTIKNNNKSVKDQFIKAQQLPKAHDRMLRWKISTDLSPGSSISSYCPPKGLHNTDLWAKEKCHAGMGFW